MKRWLAICGIITATLAAGGGVWALGDELGIRVVIKAELDEVRQDVAANTTARLIAQYDTPLRRIQSGTYTTAELQKFCVIARELGISSRHCR